MGHGLHLLLAASLSCSGPFACLKLIQYLKHLHCTIVVSLRVIPASGYPLFLSVFLNFILPHPLHKSVTLSESRIPWNRTLGSWTTFAAGCFALVLQVGPFCTPQTHSISQAFALHCCCSTSCCHSYQSQPEVDSTITGGNQDLKDTIVDTIETASEES